MYKYHILYINTYIIVIIHGRRGTNLRVRMVFPLMMAGVPQVIIAPTETL